MIYLCAPNERSILIPSFNFCNEQHSPFNFYDDLSHIRPITNHNLFELLEKNGYDIIKVKINRDKLIILYGIPKIIYLLFKKDRKRLIHTVWDIVGWSSQAIGIKK